MTGLSYEILCKLPRSYALIKRRNPDKREAFSSTRCALITILRTPFSQHIERLLLQLEKCVREFRDAAIENRFRRGAYSIAER